MLRLLRSSVAGLRKVEDVADFSLADDAIWIDLAHPTRAEELAVEAALGVELPTREEMAEIEPSSRLYQENGATVLIANLVTNADSDHPKSTPVTFVLTGPRLVTIRYAEPKAFSVFASQLERQPDLGGTGVHTFIGLLDAVVDRLADILERTSAEVERTSFDVFARPRGASFEDIIDRLGRAQVVDSKVRDSLVSLARMISFGSLADQIERDADCREHLKSLHRDIQSLTDHCSFQSGNITFLLDAAMGLINIDQNAILKRFTIFSIMFIPPTLIAGVYGMNFEHMPELHWLAGYPWALILMALGMFGPLVYFRVKKWL
ncbi:MAG TPA: magnesium transporter CorA family protein [Caulobacteraceae bacterium]|nr:magnesium transporter CorA family protein [Caulobacteraceae bacterium]